jgi:hypothetical protein
VTSKRTAESKEAGMLELCSRENQGAESTQGQGATTQTSLDTRQLITLHVENRITIASKHHINGDVYLEDIHRYQTTKGLRSEATHR